MFNFFRPFESAIPDITSGLGMRRSVLDDIPFEGMDNRRQFGDRRFFQ